MVGSVFRTVAGKRLVGFWPKGPQELLSFAYIVDTPLDADYFSQFGKLKRLRAYEKREIRRFYNWVLEQIVANLNKYKDGFQVTVRAWLAAPTKYGGA